MCGRFEISSNHQIKERKKAVFNGMLHVLQQGYQQWDLAFRLYHISFDKPASGFTWEISRCRSDILIFAVFFFFFTVNTLCVSDHRWLIYERDFHHVARQHGGLFTQHLSASSVSLEPSVLISFPTEDDVFWSHSALLQVRVPIKCPSVFFFFFFFKLKTIISVPSSPIRRQRSRLCD